ncbi:hypothetical protein ISN45_Aa01g017260 [Arabidopsis thaliana x Arabidopsis arenosa]|uniref:Uncharacterized protein n=1 Tax=Arabidopsis thaliana x Arabidopsis arenosa TaxID=1240361 RepID=A0A8T2C4R8_9BRAS|nr:hypothetical protein ISN45_Aa01g017260 [Arabidopsis thaliana x Arabidopsis arenosa]
MSNIAKAKENGQCCRVRAMLIAHDDDAFLQGVAQLFHEQEAHDDDAFLQGVAQLFHEQEVVAQHFEELIPIRVAQHFVVLNLPPIRRVGGMSRAAHNKRLVPPAAPVVARNHANT